MLKIFHFILTGLRESFRLDENLNVGFETIGPLQLFVMIGRLKD